MHFGGVPGYETGSGPVVIAAHGWGGRPAQMTAIARRFNDDGYRVIVPQLPGHAGGPATDIKQVASALSNVIEEVGWPEVLVAHSFAAMVIRLVFRDEAPRRVALLAPALDVRDALGVFGDRLRLFPWARRGLHKRLRTWDPSLWPVMSTVLADQLPGAKVLIVHDPNDPDTPFARSAELAAIRPGTDILPIIGPGHSRILSDERTLDGVARFVRAAPVPHHNVA
jgi:pimeloyl-ACP methyl ester carboxylesterase